MGTVESDEALLLRDTVATAMTRLSTSADVRAAMRTPTGWDATTWARVAGEMGLPGLAIPEQYGGAGYGYTELALALEQTGAALFCSPLFATSALAAPLLLGADDSAAMRRWLPGVADGSLTATVAFAADNGALWSPEDGVRAHEGPAGWAVSGVRNFVVDGGAADLILVVAHADGEPRILAVRGDSPGLTREGLVTLDQTRKMARLSFDGVPAELVDAADPGDALNRFLAAGRGLLAAEQAGGAARCLAMTLEYVKTRYQFGRAVGSFQVVKERLAEMLIKVESARSAAYAAAQSLDDGHDVLRTTLAARITAGDAFEFAAAETIQLHGGIGFTWEHDAHLYFKRARSSAELLGGDHVCVEALAAELAHVDR